MVDACVGGTMQLAPQRPQRATLSAGRAISRWRRSHS
jgi:hypothetical protein